MRQLASIQEITNVIPHPNADALDICTVLGWRVITKRDEFKPGDLCVYCEIDSAMPQRPEFEFLRKNNFRIRTIKLRGEISQGICFPLDILIGKSGNHGTEINEIREVRQNAMVTADFRPSRFDASVGVDVTDILGITKWEPAIPASLGGKVRGNFPSFLLKTDETRIQSIPEIISQVDGVPMYVTEKLDGSSATFYVHDGRFGVCSRNWDLDETEENSFWRLARQESIEEKLRRVGMNISIQGELMGDGIQKNKLGLKGLHFFAFQVYDIDGAKYFDYDAFVSFCEEYGFKTVPIIDSDFRTLSTVDEYVEYVSKTSTLNSSVQAEGYVFRSKASTNRNDRISFKCINPFFLLKYDDA